MDILIIIHHYSFSITFVAHLLFNSTYLVVYIIIIIIINYLHGFGIYFVIHLFFHYNFLDVNFFPFLSKHTATICVIVVANSPRLIPGCWRWTLHLLFLFMQGVGPHTNNVPATIFWIGNILLVLFSSAI